MKRTFIVFILSLIVGALILTVLLSLPKINAEFWEDVQGNPDLADELWPPLPEEVPDDYSNWEGDLGDRDWSGWDFDRTDTQISTDVFVIDDNGNFIPYSESNIAIEEAQQQTNDIINEFKKIQSGELPLNQADYLKPVIDKLKAEGKTSEEIKKILGEQVPNAAAGKLKGLEKPTLKNFLNISSWEGFLTKTLPYFMELFGYFFFVVSMIVGGYLYLISAGDEEQVTKAKNAFLASVIGLVLVFLGKAIVWYIYGYLQ